jgi:hypothetical protein
MTPEKLESDENPKDPTGMDDEQELREEDLENVPGGITWRRDDNAAWDQKAWDESPAKSWSRNT